MNELEWELLVKAKRLKKCIFYWFECSCYNLLEKVQQKDVTFINWIVCARGFVRFVVQLFNKSFFFFVFSILLLFLVGATRISHRWLGLSFSYLVFSSAICQRIK